MLLFVHGRGSSKRTFFFFFSSFWFTFYDGDYMIFFSTLFGLYRSSSSSLLLLLLLRWRTEHFFSRTIVQSQFVLLVKLLVWNKLERVCEPPTFSKKYVNDPSHAGRFQKRKKRCLTPFGLHNLYSDAISYS